MDHGQQLKVLVTGAAGRIGSAFFCHARGRYRGWQQKAAKMRHMIPTALALNPRTKAGAKEVVEDPHHRQGRYYQHHPHDAEESPAHYHGQQDRDRVDVKSPSLDVG